MMNEAAESKRRLGGLALLGLVLVLGGAVLYMLLLDVAFLRSTGLLTFVLMGLGTALGIVVAVLDRRPRMRDLAGVNVLMTGAFVYYFFGFAVLPQPQGVSQLQRAPDFAVVDHTGKQVTLGDALASGPALLVFYRGHW